VRNRPLEQKRVDLGLTGNIGVELVAGASDLSSKALPYVGRRSNDDVSDRHFTEQRSTCAYPCPALIPTSAKASSDLDRLGSVENSSGVTLGDRENQRRRHRVTAD